MTERPGCQTGSTHGDYDYRGLYATMQEPEEVWLVSVTLISYHAGSLEWRWRNHLDSQSMQRVRDRP